MKIKTLNFGVDVSDIQISNCSDSKLKDIVEICAKERLVVLKNQKMSINRFDEINNVFGIHQPADIWASHVDFPKIIRVTNKEVSKGKKGFFHRQKLHWHSDSPLAPDPEECIALWCVEPGIEGGSTEFACGVHAYNNLDNTIKKEIENAYIVLTDVMSETYLPEKTYGNLPLYEQDGLDKMNAHSRNFIGEAKGNPYDKKHPLFIKMGGGGKKTSLIVKHPVTGTTGLFFPVYRISQITGLKTPSRAKEIFHTLMDSYVGEKGKIYKHQWKKGDLVLSDQVHGLHRRNTYKGIRELYRTAFWYHDSNVQNSEKRLYK